MQEKITQRALEMFQETGNRDTLTVDDWQPAELSCGLSLENGKQRMTGIVVESSDRDVAWHALHVRPRFEKVVSRYLQSKGYEEFFPMYRSRRRCVGGREIELPLFPGYVFCKFNATHPLPILTIPGVKAVAGIGERSAPIAEHELNDVRTILKTGAHCEPWGFLRLGETVFVQYGPLAGMQGIMVRERNIFRLVISVNVLQRSAAVEIDRDCVGCVG